MKTDYCSECPKVNNCKNRGNTECETYRRIEEGLKKYKITSAYDVGSCVVYVLTKIFVGVLLLALFCAVCIVGGLFLWTTFDQIPLYFSIFSNVVFNWALLGFILIVGIVLAFLIGYGAVMFLKWFGNKWLDMFDNGHEKMENLRWKL